MFGGLMRRAEVAAAVRAERLRARVAAQLRAEPPPGVTVSEEGEAVVVRGRGLRRRLVLDPNSAGSFRSVEQWRR